MPSKQKLYKLIFSVVNKYWTSFEINLDTCFFKAQNANAAGESAVAMDASRTAKILNIVALVCGIILMIIFIALKATQQWRCLLRVCRYFGISAKLLLQWPSPPPQPGPLNRNRCLYACAHTQGVHTCLSVQLFQSSTHKQIPWMLIWCISLCGKSHICWRMKLFLFNNGIHVLLFC